MVLQISCNICGCGAFVDMAARSDSLFVRKGVLCARCGSLERHRLLHAFLVDEGLLSGNRRILHLAPEHCLAPMLRARFGANYVAADLEVGRYSHPDAVRLDLCQDLGRFDTGLFDIVIHNHVIEHVACDYRAVLGGLDALVRDGGWHIFSVPFLPGGFKEAAGGESDEWRIANLGQIDHMRIFSPEDVGGTIGEVIDLPEAYDATKRFSPERLRAMNIPEDQWRGFNNNAVFFQRKGRGALEKPAADVQAGGQDHSRPDGIGQVRRRGVLMVSANGIGQGHLTRQLAVAQAMTVKTPAFLTMSYAAGIVSSAGFPVQFVPHHGATNEDALLWNIGLEHEIDLLLDHLRADTLVYDVNFVFDGVIAALRRRGHIRGIWIRRAFWPAHHASYLGAAVHFQAVVEPGDLAEALDDGPTVAERDRVLRVPPVLQIEPEMRLGREEARAALGLSPEATVVAVDLGGSQEPGVAEARAAVIGALLGRPDVQVLELASPLTVKSDVLLAPNHVLRRVTPAFLYSRAFDAIVARAGYNTFHECLLGAIPTLFIPSEAQDMDLQVLRARFASEGGLSLALRLADMEAGLAGAISTLLDPEQRASMAAACARLTWEGRPWQNGAKAIARLIDTGTMEE